MTKLEPKQVIENLRKLSPCPIVHERPADIRPQRSCYAPKRRGKWACEQDFIYMNCGESRSWKYVQVLAHEIGHALDFNGLHPLQGALRGPRTQYRNELAAVCFEFMILRALGIDTMKSVAKRIEWSRQYVNRYARGGNQTLDELLAVAGVNA